MKRNRTFTQTSYNYENTLKGNLILLERIRDEN